MGTGLGCHGTPAMAGHMGCIAQAGGLARESALCGLRLVKASLKMPGAAGAAFLASKPEAGTGGN